MRFKLPRKVRLRKSKEFGQVYRRGRRLRGQGFSLIYCSSEYEYNRLGVSIHRKLRGVVRRNRIKRLFKEAFRLNRALFPAHADVVITVRPDFCLNDLDSITKVLVRLLQTGRDKNQPSAVPSVSSTR